MLAPCSLKALSMLPMELMCFCFKVKSSQRLKMCKFFQVVLSQLQFLTAGMGDIVARTIFSVADVAVGCSCPALLTGSLPVSLHLCRHSCLGARW